MDFDNNPIEELEGLDSLDILEGALDSKVAERMRGKEVERGKEELPKAPPKPINTHHEAPIPKMEAPIQEVEAIYQETEAPTTQSKADKILYIAIDKEKPGLAEYMLNFGLTVAKVMYNISHVRNTLILQSMPYRLVVIDTGSGRFSGTSIRKDIADILSMCDDVNKATVFFSDSALRSDLIRVVGKDNKSVSWLKYQTTLDVAEELLKYGEVYASKRKGSAPPQREDVLSFKGKALDITEATSPPLDWVEAFDRDKFPITSHSEQVQSYKPHI